MNTSLKVVIGAVVVVALGVGVWLAAPLFYDKRVSEELPGETSTGVLPTAAPTTAAGEQATTSPADGVTPAPTASGPVVLATGTFTGFDELHQASGTARVIEVDGKKYVRFEEDFTVTNGPDLYVYFGNNGQYVAETNLGRLKGNIGSQNYEIPDTIDVDDYTEVWVWCRAFAEPFGKAVLR